MSDMSADRIPLLEGLRVGISGAVPEREWWDDVPDLDQLILRFVSQLSALLFKYGGQVVHGSHPTFTPILTRQAAVFGSARGKTLTLVASKLFGDPPDVVTRCGHVAEVILTPKMGAGTSDELNTRSDSLTALRLELAGQVDAIVAVGGKLHRSTGYHPGVLEELTYSRWNGVPCFLVGNLGGFTRNLTDRTDADMVRQFTAGNRMDDARAQAMARRTEDVDVSVGRLLEHLVKHRHDFVRSVPARVRDAAVDFVTESVREVAPGSFDRLVRTGRVRQASARFAAVREAFEKGDAATLGRLLKGSDTDGVQITAGA